MGSGPAKRRRLLFRCPCPGYIERCESDARKNYIERCQSDASRSPGCCRAESLSRRSHA